MGFRWLLFFEKKEKKRRNENTKKKRIKNWKKVISRGGNVRYL